MKIWTSEHTFNHPWETVAQAAWRKYPNPMNPAVIGTDVVDRQVVNGVLHTHRLVSSKWGLPKWVQTLIGPANICYASELSEVNPQAKIMTLKTRNLTFGKYVAVDEMLKYEPHPNDKGKTLLRQEAIVTVQGVPLNNYMEDLLTSTIMSNAGKGRQAIEWVIDKINTEVIEIRNNAVKSTDEIITHTKKSLDGITSTARKSMDELSNAAKKSFDDFNHLRSKSIPTSKDVPEI
ncbi:protein slowmo [Cimex lectularius]|uniref:PRELI/MSF1 domain-containing protein n=2 Tax=Cimex lectularius TaxID=79782 RepID=A0A8I6SKX1_CIMLE|nr:protein slowmo [Cimex lectularius]